LEEQTKIGLSLMCVILAKVGLQK